VDRWRAGDVIVRREVLGLSPVPPPAGPLPAWHGRPWMGVPAYVVEDSDDQLAVYVPSGAPFGFPDGPWPTPGGHHPWHERGVWEGHGCLMVQRPGDDHAIWHFWTGEHRTFACWYVNIQTAFVRTAIGFDTQDLELDLVVFPDGSWFLKDLEALPHRVAEGLMDGALVDYVVELGRRLGNELDRGHRWWDPAWAEWTPDPAWAVPVLPPDWSTAA
jgi:Protein of unknown function (DUF402)